mgnify:FL=1
MLNRRALIKCLLLSPLVLPNIACALASTVSPKYLVLIELKGGNDGLNTIIPYNDDLYYQKRPSLALAKNSILTIKMKLVFTLPLPDSQLFINSVNWQLSKMLVTKTQIYHILPVSIFGSVPQRLKRVLAGYMTHLTATRKLQGL